MRLAWLVTLDLIRSGLSRKLNFFFFWHEANDQTRGVRRLFDGWVLASGEEVGLWCVRYLRGLGKVVSFGWVSDPVRGCWRSG